MGNGIMKTPTAITVVIPCQRRQKWGSGQMDNGVTLRLSTDGVLVLEEKTNTHQ